MAFKRQFTKVVLPCIVVLGIVGYALQLLPSVRPLRLEPTVALETHLTEKQNERVRTVVDNTLNSRDRDERLEAIDSEIFRLKSELFIREYHVGLIALIVWGLSFGVVLFLLLGRIFPVGREEDEADPDRVELPPAEEYIFESELYYKMEAGFPTRKEALEFVNSDVMRKCPYCNCRLRPRTTSERFKVQPINFFKKVPEGAIDRRLRLGSVWSVTNPNEVTCEGCQAIVRL